MIYFPTKFYLSYSCNSKIIKMKSDIKNCLWLITLYILQGVPIGLVSGSIPIILKRSVSFHQISIFNLASYPYSLKFFWSPLVDSFYSNSIGKRKSWIIPTQLLAGAFMIFLSYDIESLIADSEKINILTFSMFFLYLLLATQDIAVDGWAIELLSEENQAFASTTQTIGHIIGIFFSYTVFLSLNSAEFCNRYINSVVDTQGIISFSSYLYFWGWFTILITFLLIFKSESPRSQCLSPVQIYRNIYKLIQIKNYQKLLIVIMAFRLTTAFSDFGTNLVLTERGMTQSDFAFISAASLPLDLLTSFYSGYYLKSSKNLFEALSLAMKLKWLSSLSSFLLIYNQVQIHSDPQTLFLVLSNTFISTLANNFFQSALFSIFASVVVPEMTSTSFTFLMTCFNFAGSTARFLALRAIFYCTFELNCGTDRSESGKCEVEVHGFIFVGVVSLCLGVLMIWRSKKALNDLWNVDKDKWGVKVKSF